MDMPGTAAHSADESTIVLDELSARRFARVLRNPPPANAKLREAMARHIRDVTSRP